MSKKFKTAFDALKEVPELPDPPFNVWRTIGNKKGIEVFGNQLYMSQDCDYVTLEVAREAIEWYVIQLGGKVKWS